MRKSARRILSTRGERLAAGRAAGLSALAAIVLFVFRNRSPAQAHAAPPEEGGAVEALAAL